MHLSRECLISGCSLATASAQLGLARQTLTEAQAARREAMTGALWCDLGEHAFSARDRKRTTYRIQTIDEETGNPVEDDRVACGQHAVSLKTQPAAPALPKGADPELYTEFLEWQAGRAAPPPAVPEP